MDHCNALFRLYRKNQLTVPWEAFKAQQNCISGPGEHVGLSGANVSSTQVGQMEVKDRVDLREGMCLVGRGASGTEEDTETK
jgi:hypothetical protein